jgi:rod shape-determining protein MreD
VKALGVLTAIVLALALQTTLARFLPGGAVALDLVLVVVVYIALKNGPVTGMLTGSAAGIIQDALSIGVIGIGGVAKSVVGFGVGAIGQQFIVTAALPVDHRRMSKRARH